MQCHLHATVGKCKGTTFSSAKKLWPLQIWSEMEKVADLKGKRGPTLSVWSFHRLNCHVVELCNAGMNKTIYCIMHWNTYTIQLTDWIWYQCIVWQCNAKSLTVISAILSAHFPPHLVQACLWATEMMHTAPLPHYRGRWNRPYIHQDTLFQLTAKRVCLKLQELKSVIRPPSSVAQNKFGQQ